MAHQYNVHGRPTDGDGNYMLGLFDDGQQISEGLQKGQVKRHFGNDGKRADLADNHKSYQTGRNPSRKQEATPVTRAPRNTTQSAPTATSARTNPTNIKGIVQGWNIPIPAYQIAWFSIARRHIRDNDNNVYEFSPEGFAKYHMDVFDQWHEDNLPVVIFGDEGPGMMEDPQVTATMEKVVEQITGMTPDREEIKDLVRDMLNQPEEEVEKDANVGSV